MKAKIKEVHDYFKNKILNMDFKVIEIFNNSLTIQIEDYNFELWTGNQAPALETYNIHVQNTMYIHFTDAEKKQLWKSLNSILEAPLKAIKEKEYLKLKKELGHV